MVTEDSESSTVTPAEALAEALKMAQNALEIAQRALQLIARHRNVATDDGERQPPAELEDDCS